MTQAIRSNLRLIPFFFLTSSMLLMNLSTGINRSATGQTPAQPATTTQASNPNNLEALIETDQGNIILAFFGEDAPRHVEFFINKARVGEYDKTVFHRMKAESFIQGGDPVSKNPTARAKYGSGGFSTVPDEIRKHKILPGAVYSALQETAAGRVLPGTSGLQFVISLGASSEQTPYTIFACVVDGMDVVAKISRTPVTGMNAIPRVEIKKVTIRERTPSIEEMKKMSVVMETSLGNMKLQLLPAGAPNSVRSFLQHIRSGFYNGTAISRVMMKYYMIGGDHADWLPDNPNNKQVNLFSLWPVAFEAATEKHTRGTLSLIPENNFTKCRFSIISLGSAGLDGRNVPVARIVEGLDVLDKIAETEVDGDKPKQRIEVKKISVQ